MSDRTHREGGQTIVEFTLMLPFILLLIMALAEFGGAFYTYITVNNATSEAARWASVANPPGGCDEANTIQWRAREMSRGLLNCEDGLTTILVEYEDAAEGVTSSPGRGTGVTIRVERTYQPVTPLPNLINFVSGGSVPAVWPMRACSDARLEGQLPGGVYVNGAAHCGSNS
jgi:Flp pilus assembly protein TadG